MTVSRQHPTVSWVIYPRVLQVTRHFLHFRPKPLKGAGFVNTACRNARHLPYDHLCKKQKSREPPNPHDGGVVRVAQLCFEDDLPPQLNLSQPDRLAAGMCWSV